MREVLDVTPSLQLPAAEIVWTFTASGGPGGQHVNRSNTRVEARFEPAASPTLTPAQRDRIVARLGPVVRVVCEDTRSQHRNRTIALERLAAELRAALAPPSRPRRATRPTAGSQQRRLDDKRRRKELKDQRRRPDD